MIDSHCHLTYTPLASQLADVLTRADNNGITEMMTIGTSLPDCQLALNLAQSNSNVYCSLGIHPHHAAESPDDHLTQLAALAANPLVRAVGEIGLDYHYDFSPRDRQRTVFLRQLEIAKLQNKPIVLHSREAIDDTLAILKDFPTLTGVFHCFTGLQNEARRILDAGFSIGITGVVTYKKSDDLRVTAAFIPDDRLLIETDAPYLSPEPVRKYKNCEPSFLLHTANHIAMVRKTTLPHIDNITTANFHKLFINK